MKGIAIVFIIIIAGLHSNAQTKSTNAEYSKNPDSIIYSSLHQAYSYYGETNRDSALYYVEKLVQLARRNNQKLEEAASLARRGYQYTGLGRLPEAFESLTEAIRIAEGYRYRRSWLIGIPAAPEHSRLYVLSLAHNMFGTLMSRTNNIETSVIHFKISKKLAEQIQDPLRIILATGNLAGAYKDLNNLDSAFLFSNEATQLSLRFNQKAYLGTYLVHLGDIYLKKGDKKAALHYYNEAVFYSKEQNNLAGLTRAYSKKTDYYLAEKEKDSSLHYALELFNSFNLLGHTTNPDVNIGTVYKNLYSSYKLQGQLDSILKFSDLTIKAKDSINEARINSLSEFQNSSFREQIRLKNIEKERQEHANRIRFYILLGGIGLILLITFILFYNNREKTRTNRILTSTLKELRLTQAQLIQSEKMASLGELTAGIAHEIQNPLNFINNFSEVNKELMAELKEEIRKGNIEEVIAIATDIEENEEKINHHGNRADSIVKNMLQHSRKNTRHKELNDINALADEYLRLSYHGLRAKDKSFNANMKTDFDPSVGKLNIVGQEVSRVLLNLFNNAFYSVNEKRKHLNGQYDPLVIVSTKKEKGNIVITVTDNGVGIPEKTINKIYQPFFTTKPTGEGTGLGLSMSYEIIKKGHGGDLQVNSKEGEGAEFKIFLPVEDH